MKKKYIAAKGSALNPKHVQLYGERIEILTNQKGGYITPHDIVEDGRKESSPFFTYFDWDNDSAADKYRLHQARLLVSQIKVVIDVKENEVITETAYVSVKDSEGKRYYTSLENVMSQKDLRKQLISEAIMEIKHWRERYRNFNELVLIFEAVDKTIKVIDNK